MLPLPESRPVLSVSALARQARVLIEERFHLVWVEGEISNFRRPGSGHWYFTLKDDQAQLRCAMFAGRNRALTFRPADGTQVLVRGRLSLYEARGDFQLIAEHMEPAGEGALRAAFQALQARLDAEGLFDPARKRPLPALPRRLVLISSATGAALRDVLHVIARRYPPLGITLLPVAVQGERAEAEILAALARAPAFDPDLILLTRGGGSLEDLWCFNLESIARAVAASPVPVVSAIGHQTDFTITDFVADLRAPTPSAAAELITPDRLELLARLQQLERRLHRELATGLRHRRQQASHLRSRLVDPRARLQQQMQRADDLETRLQRALQRHLDGHRRDLDAHRRTLQRLRPERLIAAYRERLQELRGALTTGQSRRLHTQRDRLAANARTLHAVSPLATLARGYSVLTRESAGGREVVSSITQAQPSQTLTAHLRDGALEVRVEAIDADPRLPQLPD